MSDDRWLLRLRARGTIPSHTPLARSKELPFASAGRIRREADLNGTPARAPPSLRMPTAYLLQGKDRLPRGEANDLGGAELYATQKLAGLFQRLRQPTLATRTSTA